MTDQPANAPKALLYVTEPRSLADLPMLRQEATAFDYASRAGYEIVGVERATGAPQSGGSLGISSLRSLLRGRRVDQLIYLDGMTVRSRAIPAETL